jgi:hypothetical protein
MIGVKFENELFKLEEIIASDGNDLDFARFLLGLLQEF